MYLLFFDPLLFYHLSLLKELGWIHAKTGTNLFFGDLTAVVDSRGALRTGDGENAGQKEHELQHACWADDLLSLLDA